MPGKVPVQNDRGRLRRWPGGRRNFETRRSGPAQDQAGPIRGYLGVM